MKLRLSDKTVCRCPRPSLAEDWNAWTDWVRNHWRVCKPRRIVDLELPPWEGKDD